MAPPRTSFATSASAVNDTVLPGDDLSHLISSSKGKKLRLGPGLRQDTDSVVSCKCGILRKKEPNVYWIDNHQKRYVPVKGESVLGIVTGKAGDVYKVDVGGSVPATLSYLAFEGATKRNRPNVDIGNVIYGRLLVANRDMEPELVCMDSAGRSGGLGVISKGNMFHCSVGLVHKILSPQSTLMKHLGKIMPIEMVAGMNGRVWIRCKTIAATIAAMNAITNAEFMSEAEIRLMVHKLQDTILN